MTTVKISNTNRIDFGITRWGRSRGILKRPYADDISFEDWCKELCIEINADPLRDVVIEYQEKRYINRHNKRIDRHMECRVASTPNDRIAFMINGNPEPAYNRPDKRKKRKTK